MSHFVLVNGGGGKLLYIRLLCHEFLTKNMLKQGKQI